uniref:Uncharacterized protein n=1 Tax=Oryza rufipogon TaxID=4529 RepID=A0A0E0N9P7_ORYRU
MSATWFPYTAIERLWCQLEEMQNAGHSVDQCDRLKKLLHGSLMSHLQQMMCFHRLEEGKEWGAKAIEIFFSLVLEELATDIS